MTDDADSELNEAVARKLGWTYHEDLKPVCWQVPAPGQAYLRDLPDYGHSIAAAWEIVETCKAGCSLSKKADNSGYSFSICIGYDEWVSADADTAPLAIRRAFLEMEGP